MRHPNEVKFGQILSVADRSRAFLFLISLCKNDEEEEESDDEGEPCITIEHELRQRTHKPKGEVPQVALKKAPLDIHGSSVGSRESGNLAGDRLGGVNLHVHVADTHSDSGRS